MDNIYMDLLWCLIECLTDKNRPEPEEQHYETLKELVKKARQEEKNMLK